MAEEKTDIIKEFQINDKDTGSSDVQIAILTSRIVSLTEHLRTHRKDYHSRRGLIAMTSRRRKLLDYIKKKDLNRYNELLQRLKIRR